jgi:hypothetical protein
MNWERRLLAVGRALQAAIMFVMQECKPVNQRAASDGKILKKVYKI